MMKHDELLTYLKAIPGSEETFPFGADVPVFKVEGKMFALVAKREGRRFINLKCDPLHAVELRDIFTAVTAGYHMNKKHWNSVDLAGDLPDGELLRLVDHSYTCVVQGLPTAARHRLFLAHGEERIMRGRLRALNQ